MVTEVPRAPDEGLRKTEGGKTVKAAVALLVPSVAVTVCTGNEWRTDGTTNVQPPSEPVEDVAQLPLSARGMTERRRTSQWAPEPGGQARTQLLNVAFIRCEATRPLPLIVTMVPKAPDEGLREMEVATQSPVGLEPPPLLPVQTSIA